MAGVKEAVEAARKYLNAVYDGNAAWVRLEEVEVAEPGKWLVTLSFSLPGIDEPPVTHLIPQFSDVIGPSKLPRHFKVFTVDNGSVRSMKMRETGA